MLNPENPPDLPGRRSLAHSTSEKAWMHTDTDYTPRKTRLGLCRPSLPAVDFPPHAQIFNPQSALSGEVSRSLWLCRESISQFATLDYRATTGAAQFYSLSPSRRYQSLT